MIGVMVPSVFAVTTSNNIGSIYIDESTYETPTAYSTNLVKVYGTVESIVKGYRGNILFTTPDGTTDGSSFLVTKDGNFESFFIVNNNSQIGDYSVFVSYGPHPIGTLHFSVSEQVYSSQDISVARNEFDQVESEDQAAEARAAGWQRVAAAEQIAAEQRAAEQRAAEQRAAEERTLQLALQKQAQQKAAEQRAAEQRAAEQRAAEQRAAEARAEAAIRAAEAKAAQDLTNFLIIVIAIASISLLIILIKRKNKKSTTSQRSTTSTSPPNPPPSPSGNTETSTMFFYECPKCHSGDIQNNPDGSVNCLDCGYRG